MPIVQSDGLEENPIFVRHGRAIAGNGVPTAHWPLDPDFVGDVEALAERLPRREVVVSSDYRRALETATHFGKPVIDIRLREVTRVNTEDFDAKIVGYLAGEPVLGWEPYEEVSDRIHTVVDEFGSDALYVGHGTALTLYLKGRSPSLDAYAFWTQLRNPDAWQLRGTGLTRL